VLFLGYMPIISSSLRVLDCVAPIDGVRYLRSDLRVPCGEGEHAVGAIVAYAVIVVLGVGFPAALGWMLSTASAEALAQSSFQGAWGFLFSGYRTSDVEAQRVAEIAAALVEERTRAGAAAGGDSSGVAAPRRSKPRASLIAGARSILSSVRHGAHDRPADAAATGPEPQPDSTCDECLRRHCTWRPQRLLWWESVVMVRKAGIVLLAVLVTNPFFQCAGAALLLGGALIAQLLQQPYAERLFNLLEAVSLAAAASTAIITTTLLQYDVTSPEFASQPPAAMTATQWAVTVVLGAVNLGTLALLAGAWVYLQGRVARDRLKKLVAKPARVAQPAGGAEVAPGGMTTNPLAMRARTAARMARILPPKADAAFPTDSLPTPPGLAGESKQGGHETGAGSHPGGATMAPAAARTDADTHGDHGRRRGSLAAGRQNFNPLAAGRGRSAGRR
jgi:hypothetical protein